MPGRGPPAPGHRARPAAAPAGAGGWVREGDTDAGGDDDVEPADRDRVGQRAADPIGEVDRRALAGQVLGDDDELVAAEPGDGVSVADRAAQPVGDLGEHLVAGGVPEAVVDGLELVEVDEQQPDRAGGAGLAGQRLPDALHQPGPVRQPGQRVVAGQPGQLGFGALAGGDVVDDGERSLVAAVVGEDRAGRQVRPQLAAVPAAELEVAPARICLAGAGRGWRRRPATSPRP